MLLVFECVGVGWLFVMLLVIGLCVVYLGFVYYVVLKVGVNGFICVVVLELVCCYVMVNGVELGMICMLVVGNFGDVLVVV